MGRKSFIQKVIGYVKQKINWLEKKLERDIINLLLIFLLATAFVLKVEVVFWELTIQIPLIILGGILYGGYYYFIVTSPKGLPKKLRWKEMQTRVALSFLSMSTIVADVLIYDFDAPIGYVKLWMALWIVIGAEALVELLAYLKSGRSKFLYNKDLVKRKVRNKSLTNRPSIKPVNTTIYRKLISKRKANSTSEEVG